MRNKLRNRIIESNKAVRDLELNGHTFLGCCGNNFNEVHVLNETTKERFSFPNAVVAKKELIG